MASPAGGALTRMGGLLQTGLQPLRSLLTSIVPRRALALFTKPQVGPAPPPPRTWHGTAEETLMFAKAVETPRADNEALVWFGNIHPITIHRYDIRWLVVPRSNGTNKVQEIMREAMGFEPEAYTLIPLLKDGGAFVRFKCPDGLTPKDASKKIFDFVVENKMKFWYTGQEIRSHLVEGVPFVEDIMARYASNRIKVDFVGPELSVQVLFREMRRYGKIHEITVPPAAKDAPKFGLVRFKRLHGATSGRNCCHNKKVGNTTLLITYEQMLQTNVVLNYIEKHPRIALPVVAVLAGGATYAIFDPIRLFFITNKISQRFSTRQWFLDHMPFKSLINKSKPVDPMQEVALVDRDIDQTKLEARFRNKPESITILTGPKGSGKSSLIHNSVKEAQGMAVLLDCRHLLELNDDNEFVDALAKAVGFFPGFTVVSWMNSLGESIVGLTSGIKPPSSGGTASQHNRQNVQKILDLTMMALAQMTINLRKAEEKKAKSASQARETVDGKDGKAPAPNEAKQRLPVIVIDGFNNDNKDKHDKFFEILATWAAGVTRAGIAHVVFVSDNSFTDDFLSSELGDNTPCEVFYVEDSTPAEAVEMISKTLRKPINEEVAREIELLGGRYSDLSTLLKKIEAGVPIIQAVEEVVKRAMRTVRTKGLGDGIEDAAKKMKWTRVQMWAVVTRLAKDEDIPLDDMTFSSFFKGDSAVLRAMARADLVSIENTARGIRLRPSAPVYLEAFRRLVKDPKLGSGMTVLLKKHLIDEEQAKVTKWEEELRVLAEAKEEEKNSTRRQFVRALIAESQAKIAVLDEERRQFEAKWKAPEPAAPKEHSTLVHA